MRYLLDTNTWIHCLKRIGSPVEGAPAADARG
jgi:hypothetical protein